MLKWNDEFSVGIELIDIQHEHLFNIGNNAYKLLADKHQPHRHEKTIQIIEDLRQYTIFHFRTEENYMLGIRSQHYSMHKTEHDDFIGKIKNVDLNKTTKNQDEYIKELFEFVFNWIIHHVLHVDKESFKPLRPISVNEGLFGRIGVNRLKF